MENSRSNNLKPTLALDKIMLYLILNEECFMRQRQIRNCKHFCNEYENQYQKTVFCFVDPIDL